MDEGLGCVFKGLKANDASRRPGHEYSIFDLNSSGMQGQQDDPIKQACSIQPFLLFSLQEFVSLNNVLGFDGEVCR